MLCRRSPDYSVCISFGLYFCGVSRIFALFWCALRNGVESERRCCFSWFLWICILRSWGGFAFDLGIGFAFALTVVFVSGAVFAAVFAVSCFLCRFSALIFCIDFPLSGS